MTQAGTGAYLAVFLLMMLAFIGIPAVGPAVVGWAAVQASHGGLNIFLVRLVAVLGAEAGGTVLPPPPRPQVHRPGQRERGRRVMARMRQAAGAMIGAVTNGANGSGTPGCQRANWTPGFAWSLLESGVAPARAGPPTRRPSHQERICARWPTSGRNASPS
jgi:hypothetical protein